MSKQILDQLEIEDRLKQLTTMKKIMSRQKVWFEEDYDYYEGRMKVPLTIRQKTTSRFDLTD